MYSHWVDSPDDKSEASDGSEESTDLATLGLGFAATVNSEDPDDNEVGNASNGIPSPLLGSALVSKCSEKASQDHNDVCDEGNNDVTTAKSSKESKIEKQERSGHGPVNVTCPVDCDNCQPNFGTSFDDSDLDGRPP